MLAPYLCSILAEMILSGVAGGSPLVMASTTSMPETTLPNTVYWPSRKVQSAKQMKNCELKVLGSCVRAAPTTPRTKCSALNSAFDVREVRAAHAGHAEIGALAELHVAGLGHEAVDDAVEDDAVVVARAR